MPLSGSAHACLKLTFSSSWIARSALWASVRASAVTPFIVGLGLAGYLTAASIVIAAKGLLRFPELQSKREQVWIHRLTEYFLVGSFVSWLMALASLALLAR